MEPIKGDGIIVEFRGKFIMHTGHGAKGFGRKRTRTGKGEIENPPTGTMSPGWVPLAHAKGPAGDGGAGGAVSSGQSTR